MPEGTDTSLVDAVKADLLIALGEQVKSESASILAEIDARIEAALAAHIEAALAARADDLAGVAGRLDERLQVLENENRIDPDAVPTKRVPAVGDTVVYLFEREDGFLDEHAAIVIRVHSSDMLNLAILKPRRNYIDIDKQTSVAHGHAAKCWRWPHEEPPAATPEEAPSGA